MKLRRVKNLKQNLNLPISILAAFLLLALSVPAHSENQNTGETTGLPLPRFAALKSNNIKARSGPGDNYPVKAVYKRAGLPVEIVSEFKLWREIVDIEGEHNSAMLLLPKKCMLIPSLLAARQLPSWKKIPRYA
jgi:SH3-like domain-containing protein